MPPAKTGDHFVVVETTHFLHVAFHDGITQRGLAITGDYHMAVTAYTYYCLSRADPLVTESGNRSPEPVPRAELNDRWGDFGGFNPRSESNAVCVTGDFQTRKGAIGIFFAFDRTNHHAIPAVIGGNTRIKPFKGQLRAHRFRLLRTFERTALYHPATFVLFSPPSASALRSLS